MSQEFRVRDVQGLRAVAEHFVARCPLHGVYRLEGEMGAGKTTFVRTLCETLGADVASSPTFSLVNEYVASNGLRIYHFDLYRLRSLEEALDIGMEEYLGDEGALVLIEWPEVIGPLLAAGTPVIRIRDVEGERHIELPQ